METLQFCLRKFLYAIPLILGVTFISFVLMVYFGPDKTYDLLSKNPTAEQIAEIRHQLGYDQPFFERYKQYVVQLLTFDFGSSDSSGENITSIFKKTLPVTLAMAVPGFILGNLLAIFLALLAAFHRGKWQDKFIMVTAVIGMSISVLIIIIAFQVIFCSTYGLDLFPVHGWSTENFPEYLSYVAVPTMCQVFVSLGYNTRFYRAVLVEELGRDHVRTARAYGAHPITLLGKYILKNSMIPIITRIVFTLPFVIVEGSILIESYFGIPGVGLVTFNAITTGDQPVLKAVVGMTAVLYVFALIGTDILYQLVDPRVSLS